MNPEVPLQHRLLPRLPRPLWTSGIPVPRSTQPSGRTSGKAPVPSQPKMLPTTKGAPATGGDNAAATAALVMARTSMKVPAAHLPAGAERAAGLRGHRCGHRAPRARARAPDPDHRPQARQGRHHPARPAHRPRDRPGGRRAHRSPLFLAADGRAERHGCTKPPTLTHAGTGLLTPPTDRKRRIRVAVTHAADRL